MLAHLGDGSTLRRGPYRDNLKAGMKWLWRQQDEAGRFGLRADPGWLLDHVMATFVLAEEQRNDGFRGEVATRALWRAASALTGELARQRPAVGAEVRLWCRFVERSLRAVAATGDDVARKATFAAHADALSIVLRELPALAEPVTTRERAAAALLRDLVVVDGAFVDDVEPLPESGLVDPVVTFYVALQRFRRGGAIWTRTQQWVERELVKTQRRDQNVDGELSGAWDPKGAFGARQGRVGTTAVCVLNLELYYRYIRLESLYE